MPYYSSRGYAKLPKEDVEGPRLYSYKELADATKNFNASHLIGEGEFGAIYKGKVRNPANKRQKMKIVVKEFSTRWLHLGDDDISIKLSSLSSYQRSDLLDILGYTEEIKGKRYLVYEYVQNKTVQDALRGNKRQQLAWDVRVRVARDVARAMAFLHEEADPSFVFRCFKSSKVLLDEHLDVKLMDWGLLHLGPISGSNDPMVLAGMDEGWAVKMRPDLFGYGAPELLLFGEMTWQTNVWSFGVFLLELVTGKRPVEPKKRSKRFTMLKQIEFGRFEKASDVREIMDSKLKGMYELEEAHKLVSLACKCLDENPLSRPHMSTLVKEIDMIVPMY